MRISIIALGSRGDVQPYVAIGKGLGKAGHSVRVVTHAPFEDFVRGNGLDFSPLGGDPQTLVASMTNNGMNSRQRVWLPRWLVAVVTHVFPLVSTVEFTLPGILPPAPLWLGPARPTYNLVSGRIVERIFWQMFRNSSETGSSFSSFHCSPLACRWTS